MRIRSEVARAVVLLEARQAKTRPFLGRIDFHDEEALVVAKRDVVARPVFLDQLSFEQQRLRFARTVCVSKSQTASSRARVFRSASAIFEGMK